MEKFLQRKLLSTAYTVEKLRYPELPSIVLHNIRGKVNTYMIKTVILG